ncbi:TIR domain-containing protein [candidate division KSB1 bacterium]|nr:TIR domain-containing protein [candidate division KSB1 bacterium]
MKQKSFINYIVGPPVITLNQFFGRRQQINEVFDMINGKKALMPQRVVGIRRSGKTSFLQYLSNKTVIEKMVLPDIEPTTIVYINLEEGINTPDDFFLLVADKISKSDFFAEKSFNQRRKFAKFSEFADWVRCFLVHSRLVILLDEFDMIVDSENFNVNFFRNLRSLVNDRFVWIISLKSLDNKFDNKSLSEDNTSYFLNIFYSTPICLGQMEPEESDELIYTPAKSQDVNISKEEIEQIKNLAGGFPYFLQAASERWLDSVRSGVVCHKRSEIVKSELLKPGNQIRHQMSSYWRTFNSVQKKAMYSAANGELNAYPVYDDLELLASYGLVVKHGNNFRVPGKLFQHWILHFSDYKNIIPDISHSSGQKHQQTRQGLVFISYSHKDEAWKDKLLLQLQVPVKNDMLEVWHDREIDAGEDWQDRIYSAIDRAKVSILLITASFLTSEFIIEEEVPRLLTRKENDNLTIIPIILEPSPYDLVPWLSNILVRPKDGKPLSSMKRFQQNSALVEITREVVNCLEKK